MTTIHVPVSEAVEQRLRRRASERGMPLEDFARSVLEREAAVPMPQQSA
jgi:predicted DNA binding CopG/RHH family protein